MLRWDDAANASEFEGTLRACLDARGTRIDEGWRLEDSGAAVATPDERTVVPILVRPGFVDGVTVTGSDAGVEIRVGSVSGK